MTKDFSKHSELIERFRGQVLKADFEAKFLDQTKSLPKSERFILKMELKRLAGPCTRLIDLRGLVDGECREFEYQAQKHFLDSVAIKVFNENVNAYGGYTFGVYEAATNTENNFRVIYQREKSGAVVPTNSPEQKIVEKTQYPATCYSFDCYFDRFEERMNYAIPVKILFENKEVIDATSSDISTLGCKLRITDAAPLVIGQQIDLAFTGLEQEFKFDDASALIYQVQNITVSDEIQLVGLKRVLLNEVKRDAFQHFLKGYIQGHKRRYKINLDNTITALQARSLETSVLPKINELPVYFEKQANTLLPRYALTCDNNQGIYQYWQDDNKQSLLHFLLNPQRIEVAEKFTKMGKALRVYSFVHESKGKSFFYSADEVQLKEDKAFMAQFLGFAAARESFAIFELSFLTVDERYIYSPLTLSNSITKKNQYLNIPPSEEVRTIVSNLPFVMVIEELTDKHLIADYQTLNYESIDVTKLKRFGHKKNSVLPVVDEVGINYKNQRQEPRFIYDTLVSVTAQNVEWQGKSVDFSISGLKVETDKPVILKVGDIVYLSFPQLQKITSSFELARLPYQVMRLNKKKTVLNLRVHVEQHQHIGRSFFRLLIEKNKRKLTSDEYTLMTPGLTRALINLYAAAMKIPYLIIQISGSRYKVESLACSQKGNKLLPTMQTLSDRNGFYNLFPLMNNLNVQRAMTAKLKAMQDNGAPASTILYISIKDKMASVDEGVITKQASELETDKNKRLFIRTAIKSGQFFAVRLLMTRAGKPEIEFLNPELSYISSYAIHRGKQLEQDIWSVIGTVQLYDITDEVLMRYQFIQ